LTTSPSFFQKYLKHASETIQEQVPETQSMVQSQTIRINPLRIVSAVLLIISPFLTWITVSAFGLTAQATLFDVTQSIVPLQIPQNLPVVSLFATVLLILGGVILLKAPKIGLPMATAGIIAYLSVSYILYGSPSSVIPIAIAPGIGLVTATVSVAIGTISLRVHSQALDEYFLKVRTRPGITAAGLSIATTALAIDGLDHAGQGELSSFIGTGTIEPVFHLGFLVSIILVTVVFLVRKKWTSTPVNSIIIAAAFAFVLLDSAYHLSTGEVSGFLGHDSTEIMLHVLAYYGTAFLLIGRLVKQ